MLPSSSTLTKDTGKVETSFLFIEDVLKNSNSANAETIFTVLTVQLMEFGLELKKCSSLIPDGAAVIPVLIEE